MHTTRNLCLLLAALALSVSAAPALAGPILQPAGGSTDMGTSPGYSTANVVNQSGLAPSYSSLSDDFDTYIAGDPVHDSLTNGPATSWLSPTGTPTGNFDFDLGGSYRIGSFALWNDGDNTPANIIQFSLQADDNAGFTSPTVLGTFTADPNTGPTVAILPQVFTFPPVQASFVRMTIIQNNGGPLTRFGEAAFEVEEEPQAIPVDAPWAVGLMILALFLASAALLRRRELAGV